MNNFADWPLDKLNTATKYPSIPTYHKLGDRGRLTEELNVDFGDSEVVVTEKVDGTNARIVCLVPPALEPTLDASYLIGSRREFLFASGDLLHNPSNRIVETVRPFADDFVEGVEWPNCAVHQRQAVRVIYGEVYGAGVGKSGKQYSASERSFRVFDSWWLGPHFLADWLDGAKLEEVSRWREAGAQPFVDWNHDDFRMWPRVPELTAEAPPRSIADTFAWLYEFAETRSHLGVSGPGLAEGVVVRTPDRSKIAKIRFADYRRTLR